MNISSMYDKFPDQIPIFPLSGVIYFPKSLFSETNYQSEVNFFGWKSERYMEKCDVASTWTPLIS